MKTENLRQQIIPLDEWRPFPKASDRAVWEKLLEAPENQKRRDVLISAAEELVDQPFPALPATLFMEYTRTGNRSRYQTPAFLRRRIMGTFALAECLEHRGRFIDPLIDAIWHICEESTWCIPAHERTPVLPDVTRPTVDLFSTGTSFAISEVYYLLAAELDAVTEQVTDRVRLEVDQRTLVPFLEREDWWWMGGRGREVNNWNAVCNAGVLASAFYTETDQERLAVITQRVLESFEHFLNCYGPDGGCDEGPGYWNYGVGHLVHLCEMLLSRTDGRINLYEDPRVQAMAEFPHRVHLTGGYFVNFADCGPSVTIAKPVAWRYAERVGSEGLRTLATHQHDWQGGPADVRGALRTLFWMPADVEPEPLVKEADAWFPDLQWLISRVEPNDPRTLILAAKGGHNAEKHNHNDVGAFMIYADGKPLIVDMGVGEYTRDTFSSRRYELLPIRGLGHNVPLVNGVEQAPGHEQRAKDVALKTEGALTSLGLDLSEAYPAEAGIRSWERTITLDRQGRAVILRDAWELSSEVARIELPLYTPHTVNGSGPGRQTISADGTTLRLTCDAKLVRSEIETIDLDDDRLQRCWGETINRIRLRVDGGPAKGELTVRFELGAT